MLPSTRTPLAKRDASDPTSMLPSMTVPSSSTQAAPSGTRRFSTRRLPRATFSQMLRAATTGNAEGAGASAGACANERGVLVPPVPPPPPAGGATLPDPPSLLPPQAASANRSGPMPASQWREIVFNTIPPGFVARAASVRRADRGAQRLAAGRPAAAHAKPKLAAMVIVRHGKATPSHPLMSLPDLPILEPLSTSR